jgi:hypothetical protein
MVLRQLQGNYEERCDGFLQQALHDVWSWIPGPELGHVDTTPKEPEWGGFGDYRPISQLIHIFAKLVAKTLASRSADAGG